MSLTKDAEETKQVFSHGYIIQNPLTGTWFCYVNGDNRPWLCEEKSEAIRIAKGGKE